MTPQQLNLISELLSYWAFLSIPLVIYLMIFKK